MRSPPEGHGGGGKWASIRRKQLEMDAAPPRTSKFMAKAEAVIAADANLRFLQGSNKEIAVRALAQIKGRLTKQGMLDTLRVWIHRMATSRTRTRCGVSALRLPTARILHKLALTSIRNWERNKSVARLLRRIAGSKTATAVMVKEHEEAATVRRHAWVVHGLLRLRSLRHQIRHSTQVSSHSQLLAQWRTRCFRDLRRVLDKVQADKVNLQRSLRTKKNVLMNEHIAQRDCTVLFAQRCLTKMLKFIARLETTAACSVAVLVWRGEWLEAKGRARGEKVMKRVAGRWRNQSLAAAVLEWGTRVRNEKLEESAGLLYFSEIHAAQVEHRNQNMVTCVQQHSS